MKLEKLEKLITPGVENGLFELNISELTLLSEKRTCFEEKEVRENGIPHYLKVGNKSYIFHIDDYVFEMDERIEIGKGKYQVYAVTREKIILLLVAEKI